MANENYWKSRAQAGYYSAQNSTVETQRGTIHDNILSSIFISFQMQLEINNATLAELLLQLAQSQQEVVALAMKQHTAFQIMGNTHMSPPMYLYHKQ